MIISGERKGFHGVVINITLEVGDPEGTEDIVKEALLAFCNSETDITSRQHRWSRRSVVSALTNIQFTHEDTLAKACRDVTAVINDLSNRRNMQLQVKS